MELEDEGGESEDLIGGGESMKPRLIHLISACSQELDFRWSQTCSVDWWKIRFSGG